MNKFPHSVRIRLNHARQQDWDRMLEWCNQQWPYEFMMTWSHDHVGNGFTFQYGGPSGVAFSDWQEKDFLFAHAESAAAFSLVWGNWKV